MKQQIESLGWNYIGGCNCSGGPWGKYTHNEYISYQIRIHKNNTKFQIRLNGRSIRQQSQPLFQEIYEQVFKNIPTIS